MQVSDYQAIQIGRVWLCFYGIVNSDAGIKFLGSNSGIGTDIPDGFFPNRNTIFIADCIFNLGCGSVESPLRGIDGSHLTFLNSSSIIT